jgi:hypothetical protein
MRPAADKNRATLIRFHIRVRILRKLFYRIELAFEPAAAVAEYDHHLTGVSARSPQEVVLVPADGRRHIRPVHAHRARVAIIHRKDPRLCALRRVPNWVKETLDAWLTAAGIESGPLFRCVCRAGKPWGQSISEKTVWHVVKKTAASMNIPSLAPHDLRRSCARLCHDSGGELEQIQFLLGHVSVQTTERYIGCKQHLRIAVNDRLGIEPG